MFSLEETNIMQYVLKASSLTTDNVYYKSAVTAERRKLNVHRRA
jgi:hypothetical protein